MLEEARTRTAALQARMKDAGLEIALITDESTIAYFAGFWGYLSVEFGRPTFLIIRADDAPIVITPLMESEMVGAMTWVDDVRTWEDAGDNRWENVLARTLGTTHKTIGVERNAMPIIVRNWIDDQLGGVELRDITPLVAAMRMIKSPLEIEVMKQAGQIAGAMMGAAEGALAENAPEMKQPSR